MRTIMSTTLILRHISSFRRWYLRSLKTVSRSWSCVGYVVLSFRLLHWQYITLLFPTFIKNSILIKIEYLVYYPSISTVNCRLQLIHHVILPDKKEIINQLSSWHCVDNGWKTITICSWKRATESPQVIYSHQTETKKEMYFMQFVKRWISSVLK